MNKMSKSTDGIKTLMLVYGETKPATDGMFKRRELKLGNVLFWVDFEGAWVGELSFDIPSDQWDRKAIMSDVNRLCADLRDAQHFADTVPCTLR